MSNSKDSQLVNRPWWAFGHVWLVIAGPLVVVVASFITFYLAANGQDPVLTKPLTEVKSDAPENLTTLAPAMQARNHATTGSLPAPDSKNKP